MSEFSAINVNVEDSEISEKNSLRPLASDNRAKPNALKTAFNLALQSPASDLEERSFDKNSKRGLPVYWARFSFKVGAWHFACMFLAMALNYSVYLRML